MTAGLPVTADGIRPDIQRKKKAELAFVTACGNVFFHPYWMLVAARQSVDFFLQDCFLKVHGSRSDVTRETV
jgi:hypothetical protein